MSNYASLKATINANIRTNGNEEITGAVLNSVLNQIVASFGAGYIYKGVANTATDPGTPDQNVFYIAASPGVYTNFNGAEVKYGYLGILRWNGSWTVDRVECPGLLQFGKSAFDSYSHNAGSATVVAEGTRLSLVHPTKTGDVVVAQSDFGAGIVVQVYDSVSRALIGDSSHMLQAITSGYTKYGVTGEIEQDGFLLVKFVKEDGTAISAQEQQQAYEGLSLGVYRGIGVDVLDLEKSALRVNTRMGIPVYKAFPLNAIADNLLGAYINATQNKWATTSNTDSFLLPLIPGRKYLVKGFSSACRIAVLASDDVTIGGEPEYATGYKALVGIEAGETYSFIAPADAAYLNVNYTLSSTKIVPSFIVGEYDIPDMVVDSGRIIRQVTGCMGRFVDARTGSSTFGLSLKATNNDWYAGDPILVRGYKRVRYEAVYNSTSNNYYDKGGDVFYDKDLNPIAAGVRVIKRAGVSNIGVLEMEIPADAWYFRQTFTTANTTSHIELIKEGESDSGEKAFVYYGQPVNLGNEYDFTVFANNSMLGQSSARYGDYLFIVSDLLAKVACYHLPTKQLLYTLTTGITSESHWHCNQSSFGSKFYDENDPFPVLYISMQNNANGRGEAHGYRIIPAYTDGQISSFSISLVQIIYLPEMTDENCLGNPNVAFDVKAGYMWAYCRNENAEAANYRLAHFAKFAIPELTSPEVTLEDTDILEQFSDDWSMLYAQGGFIRNGKLVIMQGYANAGFINCRVIDLYLEKRQVSWLDLYKDGFRQEPEGVFWWDGKIMTNCASAYIYQLNM